MATTHPLQSFPTLLHDRLSETARWAPDKVGLVCGEERWTYAALDETTNRLARGLVEAGIRPGDRVAIFLDNRPETVIALYATLKAGAVFVILNPALKTRKLSYVLGDSGARLLVADTNQAETVLAAANPAPLDCGILWVGCDFDKTDSSNLAFLRWAETVDSQSPSREGLPTCSDTDIASLIYTSGSTGSPKGVVCAHANMVSAARSIVQYLENTEDDVVLNALPLSFDYGLYQVLMTFMFGGTVVLEKFFIYLNRILEGSVKDKITGLPIVPTLLSMLLSHDDLEAFRFEGLRYLTSTGAPLREAHIRKVRASLPNVRLYSMYGLTECKRVSYLPPEEIDRIPGSVGKPMPNCEAWVVDSAGREVPCGQTGELVVRGPNVMRGYWNDPDLTARVYRPGQNPGERILYTGDLFRKDEEGFLYFSGRMDDLLKVAGERVSPREIENVIAEIPEVAEAAVIGVPDPILGAEIKAFVVPSPGVSLDVKKIRDHCGEQLESHMVPKSIVIVADLPKTANGKIDKMKLLKNEDPPNPKDPCAPR